VAELRRRLRGDEGLSLAEVMVTLSLLAVVSTIFLSLLSSVQRGVEKQADRSNDNDQARLAVEELDREIRSGNVLYDPAAEPAPYTPYYSLRIYTQTNANTRVPGNRCVQWRLDAGRLQRRDWSTIDPTGSVSSWRTVAESVVNQTVSPPVRAFQLDPDVNKGRRSLLVAVVVQTNAGSGSPVRVEQSVTGRNTSYGYPAGVCNVIPPA
jgi:type II secretory pathway pseudopilin PulG